MEEAKIIDLLSKAHNEYVKLNPTHPDDIKDWKDALHKLQDIVGRRLLRKAYPKTYVSYTINQRKENEVQCTQGTI